MFYREGNGKDMIKTSLKVGDKIAFDIIESDNKFMVTVAYYPAPQLENPGSDEKYFSEFTFIPGTDDKTLFLTDASKEMVNLAIRSFTHAIIVATGLDVNYEKNNDTARRFVLVEPENVLISKSNLRTQCDYI